MPFYVAVFPDPVNDEKEFIDAVPESWLTPTKNHVSWPVLESDTKLVEFVTDQVDPKNCGADVEWEDHVIKSYRGPYVTRSKALERVEKMMVGDDGDTTAPSQPNKRIRRVPKRYDPVAYTLPPNSIALKSTRPQNYGKYHQDDEVVLMEDVLSKKIKNIKESVPKMVKNKEKPVENPMKNMKTRRKKKRIPVTSDSDDQSSGEQDPEYQPSPKKIKPESRKKIEKASLTPSSIKNIPKKSQNSFTSPSNLTISGQNRKETAPKESGKFFIKKRVVLNSLSATNKSLPSVSVSLEKLPGLDSIGNDHDQFDMAKSSTSSQEKVNETQVEKTTTASALALMPASNQDSAFSMDAASALQPLIAAIIALNETVKSLVQRVSKVGFIQDEVKRVTSHVFEIVSDVAFRARGPVTIVLPLNTAADLKKLNTDLDSDVLKAGKEQELKSSFSGAKRESLSLTARRLMFELMSEELACEFTLFGTALKKSFVSHHHVLRIIQDRCISYHAKEEPSREDVNTIIAHWLTNAPGRIKKRQKNQKDSDEDQFDNAKDDALKSPEDMSPGQDSLEDPTENEVFNSNNKILDIGDDDSEH